MRRNIAFIKVTAITLILLFCITAFGCRPWPQLRNLKQGLPGLDPEMSEEKTEKKAEENTAPKITGVKIYNSDGTSDLFGPQLFDETEYIIEAQATDKEGDEIYFDFSVSGGSIRRLDAKTIVWTTPKSTGSYEIKIYARDFKGGEDEYVHNEDIEELDSVVTHLQPIVLGSFSPGEEIYKGPTVIGDSASNNPIWSWWVYDLSWLSEVWIPEARVDSVSITLTLVDKFGAPLFINNEPVNIVLVDNNTSKIEPIIVLIRPTSRIISDDTGSEGETADDEAALKAFISEIEPIIVLIMRTRRVVDDTNSYSGTVPEDWNLMPYDESLEENPADDEVKVEDLLDEGEITFTGDYLNNKINWYLDNGLSTMILVFPVPDELNNNDQVDGMLLDEKLEIEYSVPKLFEDYNLSASQPTGGVGLVLTTDWEGNIIVDMVLIGFPAADAGILKGDHLLKVGAMDVKGMPLDSVVNLVIGLEGTEVDLIFGEPDTGEKKEVSLERVVLPPEEDVLTEEPTEEEPVSEEKPIEEEEICPKCKVPYSECGCIPLDDNNDK